jgi:hypothetical protein
MRRQLVDAPHAIEDAWQSALTVLPKPDAAQLLNQSVELSLDVDTTLEDGGKASDKTQNPWMRTLQPGDVFPMHSGGP